MAQSWLLETTPPGVVPDAALEESEQGIDRGATPQAVDRLDTDSDVALAACSIYGTSSTNFDFWNADSSDCAGNNCYNYASNYKTGTFAQPGRRSGHRFTKLSLDDIEAAALRDGYSRQCETSSIALSLWIWPGTDYHWYRRTADVDGQMRWCHKSGGWPATNLDNSDNIITTPADADRGNYNTGERVVWGGGGSVAVG